MLFVRLFDLRLFGFVCFLFLLVSWKGWVCDCGTPWTFLLPFLDCGAIAFGASFFFSLVSWMEMLGNCIDF